MNTKYIKSNYYKFSRFIRFIAMIPTIFICFITWLLALLFESISEALFTLCSKFEILNNRVYECNLFVKWSDAIFYNDNYALFTEEQKKEFKDKYKFGDIG